MRGFLIQRTMFLKFIKDHPSGLKSGAIVVNESEVSVKKLIEGEFVEETTEAKYLKYSSDLRNKLREEKKEKVAEMRAKAIADAEERASKKKELPIGEQVAVLSDFIEEQKSKITDLEKAIELQGGQLSEKDEEITALKIQIEKLTKK